VPDERHRYPDHATERVRQVANQLQVLRSADSAAGRDDNLRIVAQRYRILVVRVVTGPPRLFGPLRQHEIIERNGLARGICSRFRRFEGTRTERRDLYIARPPHLDADRVSRCQPDADELHVDQVPPHPCLEACGQAPADIGGGNRVRQEDGVVLSGRRHAADRIEMRLRQGIGQRTVVRDDDLPWAVSGQPVDNVPGSSPHTIAWASPNAPARANTPSESVRASPSRTSP
jgi:hypothetical protein